MTLTLARRFAASNVDSHSPHGCQPLKREGGRLFSTGGWIAGYNPGCTHEITTRFVPFCGSITFVAVTGVVGFFDAEFFQAVLKGAEGEA